MKFDQKLTYAVLLALFLQTAGALLWAGAAAQRLDAVEKQMEARAGISERLARLEAELAAMRAQLDRIEHRMEVSDAR
jgi:hypothetical protein